MDIQQAVKVVHQTWKEGFDSKTPEESVKSVLDSMMTQGEYEAALAANADYKVPYGVWVMEGLDPAHPEFDEEYHAFMKVIHYFRRPIGFTEYFTEAILDELGADDDWAPMFDGGEREAIQTAIEATHRAMINLERERVPFDAKFTTKEWDGWLHPTLNPYAAPVADFDPEKD